MAKRARKTIPIMDIKKRVNNFLRDTKDFMKPERESMAMMLESILTDTGNYKGFGYITKESMKANSKEGTTFGIGEWDDKKFRFDFAVTDSSRIYYY